jgi:hypothetical protein
MPESASAYQLRQFKPSYESLGIVVDFVADQKPFDRFEAGKLLLALKHQIGGGCHVCAFRGETLVGYCGWLPVTLEVGEKWLRQRGELVPAPPDRADEAAAITIVRVNESAALYAMMDALRRKVRAGTKLFYRRDYIDGVRPSRRRAVVMGDR